MDHMKEKLAKAEAKINPKDAKPDKPYEVTVDGKRCAAQRVDPDGTLQWRTLLPLRNDSHQVQWKDDSEVSDLVPLMPARNITRDDLPNVGDLRYDLFEERARRVNDDVLPFVLDEVVAHLNKNGGIPDSFNLSAENLNAKDDVQPKLCCEEAELTADDLARRDEALRVANVAQEKWINKCAALSVRAEKAEAERDKLKREFSDVIEVTGSQYSELQAKLHARNEELSEAQEEIATLRDELNRAREAHSTSLQKLAFKAADDLDKLTAERDELQAKLDTMKVGRDKLRDILDAAREQRDHYMTRLSERYAQAKPDAAENRPTLDREAVETLILNWKHGDEPVTHELADKILALAPAAEGWPDWLGPKVDPDDYEVTRDENADILVDGVVFATAADTPNSLRSIPSFCGVEGRARREAMARYIESEQAETDDEEQRCVNDLTETIRQSISSIEVDDPDQANKIASDIIDAGWTPPENGDRK